VQLTAADDGEAFGVSSRRARERLVERLRQMGVTHPDVLEAIGRLPRHFFVDEALASRAYDDSALPIGWGQTISQPYMVARMTEILLAGVRRERVLEIGTGSGFHTAVLASLVRRVYSIERIADLKERAERRLRALKLRNVRLRHADGAEGWPEYAPFDAILVTAAPPRVPRVLANQLACGGCMVTPIGTAPDQSLLRLVRTRTGWRHEALEPVSFVPFLEGTC
jgi:protein-L-isoaspartate(D-aspartate) O-methyltransferase